MDKTHYERRSHEQGNYEITPKYKDQVVVTIKSLATGQTMKVYLDEPTQRVQKGVNITTYTGHFYEEEFMVTSSEGFEVTGFPLMYPYFYGIPSDSSTVVIDAENHYYSQKITNSTDSINMAEFPIHFGFTDIPIGGTSSSGNIVEYEFPPYSDESIVFPGNPGGGSGLNPGSGSELHPGTEEGGLH